MHPLYMLQQDTLAVDDVEGLCFLFPADDSVSGCGGTECVIGEHNDVCADQDDDDAGSEDADGTRLCSDDNTQRRQFGDACSSPSECTSGYCLAISGQPYCTRDCSAEDACPENWRCTAVDSRNVCAPDDAASGCSAMLAVPPHNIDVYLLVVA